MCHGVTGSAQHLIVSGPDGDGKAAPYQLADAGYDVWLLNARGNFFSRDHLWLDPDSDALFWNFSFEEIANYDLKSAVEFLQQERANDQKVALIGYSQGTTVITYALATCPEFYKTRARVFAALGPAVLLKYS